MRCGRHLRYNAPLICVTLSGVFDPETGVMLRLYFILVTRAYLY
jgi:hypothetical protein